MSNTTKAALTDAEIDSMEAGEEMDAQVALQVMGLTLVLDANSGKWDSTIAHYSTDIAAAWEVVEEMRARGCYCSVVSQFTTTGNGHGVDITRNDQWAATFPSAIDVANGEDYESPYADGDTPALAICRAALKTIL